MSYESLVKLFDYMKSYIQGENVQSDTLVDLEQFVDLTVKQLEGLLFLLFYVRRIKLTHGNT